MKKILCVVLLCVLLTGCASAVPASTGADVSGFWVGIWHGLILPIAFVISLFNHDVGIYEIVNTGLTYNLGYVIGVSVFGLAAASSR